jgi:hypothetical protein
MNYTDFSCKPNRNVGYFGLNQGASEGKYSKYVEHYNEKRLHSGIGYIAPKDKLEGREAEIWKQRDEQLENARKNRADKRRSGYVKEIVNSRVEEWFVSNSD